MATKAIDCKFVGSFFEMSQLPQDRLPQIAFAGRSNVGKSTLLNRLVDQRKMAKVSSSPGKTRSLNFFLVNNRFYFVDLPGYGYAKVALAVKESWTKLVQGYLDTSPDLIGLIVLLDCRREPNQHDVDLLDWLSRRGLPALAVVTKVDKLNRDQTVRKVAKVEKMFGVPTIAFSSVTNIGRKALVGSILDLVLNYRESRKSDSNYG
ncbi:MAG: ribosome biogenesis GTP-binding protein YihA/YsxC [bacterium]